MPGWADIPWNEGVRECFIEWLARQVERDDPVGDLARDWWMDGCGTEVCTVDELRAHLVVAHAIGWQPVWDALADAEAEWWANVEVD